MRRTPLLLSAWVASLLVLPHAVLADGETKPAPTIEQLLDRVVAPPGFGDEAVEVLAAHPDHESVLEAAGARLQKEEGFQQRLALGYILGTHGERKGLEILVEALEQTGHLGYVYLRRLADRDYGWNQDGSSLAEWRTWLAGFTAEEYRRQVERERLPAAVRRAGTDEFAVAARLLESGAERAVVAVRLREVAAQFPQADIVDLCLELAEQLDRMAQEDAAWKEPPAPAALAGEAWTEWLLFHLRDARAKSPGTREYPSVLAAARGEADPATALVALGTAAVPPLLRMLENRRPIRAFLHTWKGYSVLRLQDAALEILNEILPRPTYDRGAAAAYLSQLERPDRKEFIEEIRWWAQASAGKSRDALALLGLTRSTTREAVTALRSIAADPAKVPAVLEVLRTLYGERSFVMRPLLCELMADLGDTSKVREVLAALDAGEYSSHGMLVEGDSAAGINAELTAQRIRTRYGKAVPPGEATPK